MAQTPQSAPKDDSALLSAIGITGALPTESEGLRDIRESILVKKGEAETATSEAKRKAALTREAGEGALYKAEREATEPYREELLKKTQERVYPPPTRDNFKEFAGMFSVLSALTFAVGGGGRGSGMSALAALNGAIDGWNRGNKDAFDRGMKEYDKKLAEYKTSLETTREALRVVADKEGLKTKEGLAALKRAELNDAGVAAAMIKEGRFKDAINHVDNLIRKADAVEKQNQTLKNQQFMIDYREGRGKPLSQTEVTKIVGSESLKDSLQKLEKDFKPEFASLGVFGVGADLQMEAMRRLPGDKAQAAISWWSRYRRLQTPERHSLFGATLTGNELKDYQSYTAKTSDSAKTVKTMLQDQINYLEDLTANKRLKYEAAGYRMPTDQAKVDFERTYDKAGVAQPSAAPSAAKPAAAPSPRATLRGRPIVVRDNKWVFEDTGEEAK